MGVKPYFETLTSSDTPNVKDWMMFVSMKNRGQVNANKGGDCADPYVERGESDADPNAELGEHGTVLTPSQSSSTPPQMHAEITGAAATKRPATHSTQRLRQGH